MNTGGPMDSHPVKLEQRPPHVYRCEHCGHPFLCTTAQYWHEDAHEGGTDAPEPRNPVRS